MKRKCERGPPVDVYAYAIILWEMLAREVPWLKILKEEDCSPEDLRELILEGRRPDIPNECSKELEVNLLRMRRLIPIICRY